MNNQIRKLKQANRSGFSGRANAAPLFRVRRVGQRDILDMTKSLGVLLRARLTLDQSLRAFSKQTANPHMRSLVEKLLKQIEKGASFSTALKKHQNLFGAYYIQMVVAGEESSKLEETMSRLAAHIERTLYFQQKLRLALIYPAILMVVSVATIVIFSSFIIPNLQEVFAEFNTEPPAITTAMLKFASASPVVVGILLVFFLTCFLVHRSHRFRRFSRWLDKLILSAPLLGNLLKKSMTARFARTMSVLISNSKSVSSALDIASGLSGNICISEDLLNARKQLQKGRTLGHALHDVGAFPDLARSMVALGEQASDLAGVFQYIAEHYENEIEVISDSIGSLLEPVFVVLFGLVAGFIVISLYVPMFHMVTALSY